MRKPLGKQRGELERRLQVARAAADGAGRITLRWFCGDFKRETKRDGSVVTIADREGERLIRRTIQRSFPQDGILGEEFEEKPGASRYRWIVDPIDGTLSFARGVPLYGVLIGVEDTEERDCPAGVVHVPALGETVYALRGAGCTWERRNGRRREARRARVSRVNSLDSSLLLATDFWNAPDKLRRAALLQLAGRAHVRRTWADCYGYVLVATGRAELMLDAVMNPWDCAAIQPVVEEAGGRFTDWKGVRTIYGGCAVASNGLLHAAALQELAATSILNPPVPLRH